MRLNVEPHPASADEVLVHTSSLFDSKQKRFVADTTLVVSKATGLIVKSYQREDPLPTVLSGDDVDLRGLTVLPGLVDAHTHVFLHPYSETASLHQMRDESAVERVVRATAHARAALAAGYTTYRDLGSEGLGAADAAFRDTINRGLTPGPRLFVATECIASSAGYAVRQEHGAGGGGLAPSVGGCCGSGGTTVPRIADPADGVDGVRAAVRRRLGAGADVIKVYADYRRRQLRFPPAAWPGAPEIQFPPAADPVAADGRNPNSLLFGQDEMDALVAEAKRAGAPVAAHAQTAAGVIQAARAGATSVEHGMELSEAALDALAAHDTLFVPTLAVFEAELARSGDAAARRTWAGVLAYTKAAFDRGVRLACGGDTGAVAHGANARELELFARAGVPVPDVLQSATLRGWEACGGELCSRRFGWLGVGWAADLVAVAGDPLADIGVVRDKVVYVMKDAQVYKDERR